MTRNFKTVYAVKGLSLGVVLLAAGCTPAGQDGAITPDVAADQTVTVEPLSAVDPAASASMQALAERKEIYADVFQQAERQGMVLGGLRGVLIGALVDGERGALAGAFLGAIFGASYSVSAADRLLQERDEFLNRQEIIESILSSSKLAADRSAEDAELVTSALDAQTLSGEEVDPETFMQFTESVAVVRRAVELRAVLIEEALREAAPPEAEAEQVKLEIARQLESLRKIREQEEAWSKLSNG